MKNSQVDNPAKWHNNLGLAWLEVILGLAGCGFVIYSACAEYQANGALDRGFVLGNGIIGLVSLFLLNMGIFLLPRAWQHHQQQQAIQDGISLEAVAMKGEPSWYPSPGITGHGGRRLTHDGDYFVPPPAEIGQLISAYTSLREGTRPRSMVNVLVSSLALGAFGALLGWIVMMLFEPNDKTASPIVASLLGVIALAAGWGLARFKHACSYVGTEGIARFICAGHRQGLRKSEIFRFRDADDLRTSQTEHYENGAYQRTEFRFYWSDMTGRLLFKITDSHLGSTEGQNPWIHMPYQWACAAEAAWCQYRLAKLPDELERNGSIRFRLSGADWLAVGPGFLDLHRGGETIHSILEDIEEFSLSKGVFELYLRGGRPGLLDYRAAEKIAYGEVANVQLFLLVVKRHVGVDFLS